MSIKTSWRNSSSLIILIKNQTKLSSDNSNYKVLTFKRSEKTAFMSNHIVFPGGAHDKYDEAQEWIDLYSKMGISQNKFDELKVNGPRPLIFQTPENVIAREISLRITAIRETFEEVGVLICKTREQFLHKNKVLTNSFNEVDVLKWQPIVHNDSSKFIELCREYDIAPDLWSLYEWFDWMTPSTFNKRFETAFFMVALENLPAIFPEENEVAEYLYTTPQSLLNDSENKKVFLPPPLIYEVSRLNQFEDIVKLIKFAVKRTKHGLTCIWPITYQVEEGFVQILPGDDEYPKQPNFVQQEKLQKYANKNAKEMLIGIKNMHRIEINFMETMRIHINIEPLDGHVNTNVSVVKPKL